MEKKCPSDFATASIVLALFVGSNYAALGDMYLPAGIGCVLGVAVLSWSIFHAGWMKRRFTLGVGVVGLLVFGIITALNVFDITPAVGLGVWAAYGFFGISTVQYARWQKENG